MTTHKVEYEIKFQDGKPEKPGLYDCLVNGKRRTLQFKRCVITHRSYWLNIDGTDVDPNATILWRSGKVLLD